MTEVSESGSCWGKAVLKDEVKLMNNILMDHDVPHDKPLKALHDDGCECNGMPLRQDTGDFFGTGTMEAAFKHVGAIALPREMLKMLVKINAN